MYDGSKKRLIYLLNVAQKRLQRWTQGRTAKGGVTSAQAGLLFFLDKNDGAPMSEAAKALDVGLPGMSGLVERMLDADLLVRRADPEDGRVWRLWLTDAGRKAVKRAKASLSEVNARLTEGFSEAELEIVVRWLSSVQQKFPLDADD